MNTSLSAERDVPAVITHGFRRRKPDNARKRWRSEAAPQYRASRRRQGRAARADGRRRPPASRGASRRRLGSQYRLGEPVRPSLRRRLQDRRRTKTCRGTRGHARHRAGTSGTPHRRRRASAKPRSSCKWVQRLAATGPLHQMRRSPEMYPFRTRLAVSAVVHREEIPANPEKPTPGLEPGTPSLRGKDE
jgi:hypothetical protein